MNETAETKWHLPGWNPLFSNALSVETLEEPDDCSFVDSTLSGNGTLLNRAIRCSMASASFTRPRDISHLADSGIIL